MGHHTHPAFTWPSSPQAWVLSTNYGAISTAPHLALSQAQLTFVCMTNKPQGPYEELLAGESPNMKSKEMKSTWGQGTQAVVQLDFL